MFIQNYSLLPHNSFGVDIFAGYYTQLTQVDQVPCLMRETLKRNLNYIILGEGSNMLFTRNFDGLVIHNCLKGIEKISEDEKEIWCRVGAGENWDTFVSRMVESNYGGVENLSLIPGSVGASPVQNIGAYGAEVKDCIVSVEGYTLPESEFMVFNNEECRFGYRESIFKNEWKNRFLVTSVVFRLSKYPVLNTEYGDVKGIFMNKPEQSLKTLRETIMEIRGRKLPDIREFGNAGSFFKNPVISALEYGKLKERWPGIPGYEAGNEGIKIPAAWLIEKTGWKGVREGRTGSWPLQPLVLVNYGSATGMEIFEFSEKIRISVFKQFGIGLMREVNVY